MGSWRVTKQTDEYRELVNIDTGAIKKVVMASNKQFDYLQSLRGKLGKAPLKNRPAAYAAGAAIDKLLEKIEKQNNQQKLV